MKKNPFLLLFIILPFCMKAQQGTATKNAICGFEKLFTVEAGMDMPSAITRLKSNSKITLLNQTARKIKPYANTGGDSILHETVTYRIDSSECFNGRDNSIKFEFADGKLYKAFLETMYRASEYADMMSNFDYLNKEITPHWKYKKDFKLSGGSMQGFGYNFTNTNDKKAKTNMCSLQYVKEIGSNPSLDKYRLEVLWANLNNTRMENSKF